jgi:hypothetical protein
VPEVLAVVTLGSALLLGVMFSVRDRRRFLDRRLIVAYAVSD